MFTMFMVAVSGRGRQRKLPSIGGITYSTCYACLAYHGAFASMFVLNVLAIISIHIML